MKTEHFRGLGEPRMSHMALRTMAYESHLGDPILTMPGVNSSGFIFVEPAHWAAPVRSLGVADACGFEAN